jgi:hypothetical protein
MGINETQSIYGISYGGKDYFSGQDNTTFQVKPEKTLQELYENLILEYFINNNTDHAFYNDLNNYFKIYGFLELTKHEIIYRIKLLRIFERVGKTRGKELVRVNKRKVDYRCKKRGISKRELDKFGNLKIPGLDLDEYIKFGIGISNKIKSIDPYRTCPWKNQPGFFYNPYKDSIEVSKITCNGIEQLKPIKPGVMSPIRDQIDYRKLIWCTMRGLHMEIDGTFTSNMNIGTDTFYETWRGDKSFHNKIKIYLPELEDCINALNEIGWDIKISQKKKAVELLGKYDMQKFQAIRKTKKCGPLKGKSYSPIVNASFILYVLECEGMEIPNTRQCKFLRSIKWTKCRYELIKEILNR